MYRLLRSFLFLLPAETAHHFTFGLMKIVFKIPFVKLLLLQTYKVENSFDFLGLKFPNRVGLAAGLDKNAAYLNELSALGFGFIEIGTVTPLPQPGNELPRLFRLKKDESLINRMGFNNEGVEVVAERLKNRPKGLIVGGNIGKNKITPNENAVQDYLICFEKLYNLVDYFVVNVSSPNTPNLRELQDKKPLMEILSRLIESRNTFIKKDFPHKPILLKIAPDLSQEQLDDVVVIVNETGIEGIVATNTTISREGLKTDKSIVDEIGAGGLSGKILSDKSTDVIKYINQKSEGKIPMIGVGGIYNEESAMRKIEAGASLVQVYTGFIYEGPVLVKRIANFLRNKI
ncbi:MAG: quinone-dependent dihydroorotate dehydrogenase [Bacteroidia bacterium]